jgi:predicted molibdopterin-dependent oxidoreductase YjgC
VSCPAILNPHSQGCVTSGPCVVPCPCQALFDFSQMEDLEAMLSGQEDLLKKPNELAVRVQSVSRPMTDKPLILHISDSVRCIQ